MKKNRPYFPCQTEDGRTFVMRGARVIAEIPGFDTTRRWRLAQIKAAHLNQLHIDGRMTRRDRIALIVAGALCLPVVADVISGGALSLAIVKAVTQ